MAISTTSTGPNSAMIEYSNDTWQNLMDHIDTFLTTHGWTQTKNTFVYSGMTGARVYEALDKDGITKKTMVIAYIATGYLGTMVFESFAPAGTVGVNMAYLSSIAAPGSYCQRLNPTTENGRLHVFATSKWFAMFNIGAVVGSANGNSFNGCFEISKANVGDNTPNHVFANGYLLSGAMALTGTYLAYFCVSPVKTFGYAADPTSAAQYTRVCTPMGSWGGSNLNRTVTYQDQTQLTIILPNPAPFGTTLKHQVHDISIALDCITGKQAYVKGKMYGMKIFTTGGAVSGDVFTAKCDTDFFLDLGGTDTDHFIFKNYDGACFGIPL